MSSYTTYFNSNLLAGYDIPIDETTIVLDSNNNLSVGQISDSNILNIDGSKILAGTSINLGSGSISGNQINGTTGNITTLNSTTGNITTLNSTTGNITNLITDQLTAQTTNISLTGNIIPSTDSTYNLGSPSNKFLNGYFDNIDIGSLLINNISGLLSTVDTTEELLLGTTAGTLNNIEKSIKIESTGHSSLKLYADTNNLSGEVGRASLQFATDNESVNANIGLPNNSGVDTAGNVITNSISNYMTVAMVNNTGIQFAINSDVKLIMNSSRLYPPADISYDLGNTSNKYLNVYSQDIKISNNYTFTGDNNSYFKLNSVGDVGIFTNNIQRLEIDTQSINTTLPIRVPNGSVSAPSYSFSGSINSGWYSTGPNNYYFSVQGVDAFQINNNYTHIYGKLIAWGSNSASAPNICFATLPSTTDLNTGFFQPTTTDSIGVTCGGVSRFEVDTSKITVNLAIQTINGSAASPSYAFNSGTNMGMYRNGTDVLAFSTGGTGRILITNTAIRPLSADALDCGASSQRFGNIYANNLRGNNLYISGDRNGLIKLAGWESTNVTISYQVMTLVSDDRSLNPYNAYTAPRDMNINQIVLCNDDTGSSTGYTVRINSGPFSSTVNSGFIASQVSYTLSFTEIGLITGSAVTVEIKNTDTTNNAEVQVHIYGYPV